MFVGLFVWLGLLGLLLFIWIAACYFVWLDLMFGYFNCGWFVCRCLLFGLSVGLVVVWCCLSLDVSGVFVYA